MRIPPKPLGPILFVWPSAYSSLSLGDPATHDPTVATCAPSCAITVMCRASRQIPSNANAMNTSSPTGTATDFGNGSSACPN